MSRCMSCQRKECSACTRREPELSEEEDEAWDLWLNMVTQWRVGPTGVIGLDYGILPMVARFLGVHLSEAVFRKIRGLEMEVLKSLRAKESDQPVEESNLESYCLVCKSGKSKMDCETCNLSKVMRSRSE